MREDPAAAIAAAETLIQTRPPQNYTKAAKTLAEFRNAVGGEVGSRITDQAAEKTVKKNPTLRHAEQAFNKKG
jgi:hypothetical protein